MMSSEPVLSYEDAKHALAFMQQEVEKRGKAGVLAVCDAHGDLLAFARMDGAPLSSIAVAMNKAYSAARERKSTREIGKSLLDPKTRADIAFYGDPRFTGWGGGTPVFRAGTIAGAVAVAGLFEEEDVEISAMAARELEPRL